MRGEAAASALTGVSVPPLGLATSDVREQVREQVNAWIYGGVGYGGTTATFWADIASAVADPDNTQNINPSYLDASGNPTATYYATIANTIAGAIDLAENSPVTPIPMARYVGHVAGG